MHAGSWRLSARYCSYDICGTEADVARALVNLVNVQGAGPIAVSPPSRDVVAHELTKLDPTGSWRRWWATAAGECVELANLSEDPIPTPCHALPDALGGSGRSLGINLGGHYLRLVWLLDGQVEDSAMVRIGTGTESALIDATIDDFVRLISRERSAGSLARISIAWSAPRTALGLRAMSILMDHAGEIAELLDRGQIDLVLSRRFHVPVSSWNDGEAVAAAEGTARCGALTRPLLTLKLGTSMASGLVTSAGVCALPMQLAKCILRQRPIREYSHPATGTVGTARDMLGADPITRTYRFLMSDNDLTYDNFCDAAVAASPMAALLVRSATDALAEVVELIRALWGPVDLLITGKNVEREDYRRLFAGQLTESLSKANLASSVLDPIYDRDLVAAIGAVCLAVGRNGINHKTSEARYPK